MFLDRAQAPRWVPQWLIDPVIGVVVAIGVVQITRFAESDQTGHRALDNLAWVLLVAESLALAGRRRRPVGVWAIALAANVAYFVRDYPNGPVLAPLLFALYAVALVEPRRRALAAAVGTMASIVAVKLAFSGDGIANPASIAATGWGAAVVFKGLATRSHRENIAAAREKAQQAKRAAAEAEDEKARRRADEERLRIAREVHDVVSHNLAVIRVQAGVALHLLDQDKRPEHAREALEAIKQSSSDALADLRSTLDVLRQGGSEPRDPVASMARIKSLVDNATAAGVEAELTVTGDLAEVPSTVGLAAYRLVQESLTNVVRHAGARSVWVRIDVDRTWVALEIADDGQGAATDDRLAPVGGEGHGLTGMEERVAALGGTFTVADRPGGGFRVSARLPVTPAVAVNP